MIVTDTSRHRGLRDFQYAQPAENHSHDYEMSMLLLALYG